MITREVTGEQPWKLALYFRRVKIQMMQLKQLAEPLTMKFGSPRTCVSVTWTIVPWSAETVTMSFVMTLSSKKTEQ